MKTKEQVLEFIRSNGFTQRAMDKICGFLIANNIKGIDENIVYKVGDKDFNFFFNWFTSDISSYFVLNAVLEVYSSWAKDIEKRISEIERQMKDIEVDSNKDKEEEPKKEDEEIKNAKFKVGDRVDVIDTGYICTTYSKMFEEMNFKNKTSNYTEFSKGTIFGVSIHGDYNEHIYGVRSDKGEEMLILENGLKKHEYKEGDYVKVVKKGSYWNPEGKMDYLLNSIVKIGWFTDDGFLTKMENGYDRQWYLNLNDVEPSTYEEYDKQWREKRDKEYIKKCKQDRMKERIDFFEEMKKDWKKI